MVLGVNRPTPTENKPWTAVSSFPRRNARGCCDCVTVTNRHVALMCICCLQPAEAGIAKLEKEAKALEKTHPSAAASLREGLADMFTVNRLGLPEPLERCLNSTNVIESVFSGSRSKTRRVTHWQNGSMALRWAAASLVETEKHFKKLMGYQYLAMLDQALKTCKSGNELAEERKAS
jgi:putative transposase